MAYILHYGSQEVQEKIYPQEMRVLATIGARAMTETQVQIRLHGNAPTSPQIKADSPYLVNAFEDLYHEWISYPIGLWSLSKQIPAKDAKGIV